ncbi:MAG: glycosyl transferase family protein [Pseudomonadota bacterium]
MTHDSRFNPAVPEHPFAPFVRILGKGKTGTRSLTREEAREAFGMVLRGEVEELQLGAFLMLLRVKEETGEELAGFVQACRDEMTSPPEGLQADLDWSSYAGKRHQHPWYLLSALLLAEAGHRVFIHGSGGHTPGRLYTEHAMTELALPIAASWQDVDTQLSGEGISYLSLAHFIPRLHHIMQLKPILGLRSPVNTLTRMLNPLACPASLQSIFHPAYGELHRTTDRLLGQQRSLVFKGDSGEVEIKPQADTRLQLLVNAQSSELTLPRRIDGRVASVEAPSVAPLRELWQGRRDDPYGELATLATAAVALLTMDEAPDLDSAHAMASSLWQARRRERLG